MPVRRRDATRRGATLACLAIARLPREPLEWIEGASPALDADDREEARRVLERLEKQLDFMFFRGGILLEGADLGLGSERSRD